MKKIALRCYLSYAGCLGRSAAPVMCDRLALALAAAGSVGSPDVHASRIHSHLFGSTVCGEWLAGCASIEQLGTPVCYFPVATAHVIWRTSHAYLLTGSGGVGSHQFRPPASTCRGDRDGYGRRKEETE